LPGVTDVVSLNRTPDDGLLKIAGVLERDSEHHLASAILDGAALLVIANALRMLRFEGKG
jgi:cation transport ATPase